jgi:hypothetical protein
MCLKDWGIIKDEDVDEEEQEEMSASLYGQGSI